MHSLREKHVAAVSAVVSEMPAPWSLERHEGCDGDLTLVLMPHDANAANLVVTRTAGGFHLDADRAHDYQAMGRFNTLAELVATIREMISSPVLTSDIVLANR